MEKNINGKAMICLESVTFLDFFNTRLKIFGNIIYNIGVWLKQIPKVSS